MQIDLPPMGSVADVPPALAKLLEAVAGGELTPAEGQSIAAIVDRLQSALALTDIEQRLQRLETGHS